MLVLPYSNFKPVKTIRESLGVPGGEVLAVTKAEENRVWLDTTCSLYYIKGFSSNPENLFRQRHTRVDYAKTHATKPECQEDDLSDVWESESDSEDDDIADVPPAPYPFGERLLYPATAGPGKEPWSMITRGTVRPEPRFHDLSDETQLMRGIIPSFGETPLLDGNTAQHTLFSRMYADRRGRMKNVTFSSADLPTHLVKDFCLLRTSPTDIELQPFDRDAPCVECKYLLTYHNHTGAATPWDLHPTYSERVSMLLHVPELNLVVAGSPTGRVALLTLTKTAKRLHLTRVRYGFRVDCVLPRKEEDDRRVRPACTLVGVAVSPVPCRPGRGLKLRSERGVGRAAAVVYRLILHYKDHTILMYDIARGGGQDELLIF